MMTIDSLNNYWNSLENLHAETNNRTVGLFHKDSMQEAATSGGSRIG